MRLFSKATRLVIVLVSRVQKSSTGDNNFVKWKGTFRSDRPKWPDRSKWTTFKAGPEYSGRAKPKWSVPFVVPIENSGVLGWMESAHWLYFRWLAHYTGFYSGWCSHVTLKLKQLSRRRQREHQKKVTLISQATTLHEHHAFWYTSETSTARPRSETKS